ncbi:glyco_hydro_56 domain-containing protein [Esox lucius]|uniref:Hyaluronidase n=1 Tax=Esox lucius TaxID=8010 RepID=A0A3P8ZXK0_ESOLU|nr:glyco_hydro_56 domain-containing protein [Esox lucius]
MAGTELELRTGPSAGPHRVVLPLLFQGLLLLTSPCIGGPPQPACSPLLPGQPFLVLWGIPNKVCSGCPDPGAFGMEREGLVAMFYEDTIGKYPYYTDQRQPVNGGLPQHTRLDGHLQKTGEDLVAALPSPGYQGLGVLRWGKWSPQWGRNRENQGIYLEGSRALLRTFFPDWTTEELEKWSQVDFEAAAQSIITETLREVRRLRPKALWGLSPYPDCYNSVPGQLLSNYTGRCPAAEMALNDEAMWLWKLCSALYPALSLEKLQGGTSGVRLYTSNQIREALRVAGLAGTTYDLPVFPLVRSVYTSTNTFLSLADLVNTVGESAAMGAAGVIIWDKDPAVSSTNPQRACSELATFIREVLGPYAVNVTTAARLCGVSLCQGRGRCVRRKPESSVYLQLPPPNFLITRGKTEGVQATGRLDPGDLEAWKRDFQCQWYESLEGAAADEENLKDKAQDGAQGTLPTAPTPLSELNQDTPVMDHSGPSLTAPVLPLLLIWAITLHS